MMKTNILISTLIGFNKVISRTYSRLDSLSIVSRQSDLRTYSAESSCETFSVGQCSPHAFPFEAKSQLASSHQFVLAILVACLTVLGVGNAWGTETTFDWSSESTTATAGTTDYVATDSPITLTFSQGTHTNNAPRINKEGSVRMYAGNTLTIASSSGNITRVVFTPISESYDATNLSYDDEDLTSDDWTLPSASASVTLTAGTAARFKSIKVYSGSSTYTVTIARNNTSYGTVSTSSVGSLSSGAAITKGTGANINKITIGGTTVTATPAAQDADYDYAFSSWTVPGNVTTVTADITITANFMRTARPLTNYRTVCCLPLTIVSGAISVGSINETGGTASWSWSGATTGISKNILKVYNTSDVLVKTIDNISASATSQSISGLDPCTSYYVTLTTVASSGYCAGEEQGKSSNFTTNGWAVHYTGGDENEGALLSNVTKVTGASQACLSEDYVATFTANTGYKLPDNIVVYIAGVEVDVDDAYTWSISNGTGTLTVETDDLSEEIDVRIIGECVEPVIGTDPADASYQQGASPSALTVAATLVSGTLTYQWQKSTDGGDNWSNESGTGYNTATYAAANISTALVANGVQYRCIVGNSDGGCSVNSAVATITVTAAANFVNGATVFIQAESSSAWNSSACVKAWFNASGAGGAAQATYWLFNATGVDDGKKIYAAVVPADGDLNQVTLQRFASNCSDFYNANGTLTQASSGGSNIFCSNGSGNSNVAWKATALTMSLMSSDNWNSSVATVTDQGSGEWSGTYEYTPTGTSTDYVIATNYNGNLGNTGVNPNATLSGMIVGSTYNVTATFNIMAHTLVMSKEFVKGEVSFDLQGHGDAISKLTNVMAGSKISAPSEPSATGYTFGGWFTDAECTDEWNFATDVVNETMTLYAKWTANIYTITKTFSNVANAGLPASFTYTGNTTTALNSSFTVDGDNFFLPSSIAVTMGGATLTAGTDYTYNNSTGAFTFDRVINGDIVITASATAKLTGIAITTQPTTRTYLAGETFSSAGAVVRATMGDESTKDVTASVTWTPSGALSAGTSQTVTATYTEAGVTKTATTTIDVYSVTINKVNMNGVAIANANVTVGRDGRTLSQSVGETNYLFNSWNVTAGGVTISDNTITGTPNANIAINAKFHDPITVTWKVGNGAASGSPTTEVKYNTAITALPSTPADNAVASCGDANKFMGWTKNGKIETPVQSAPADLFTTVGGATALTTNTTYRAVFATKSTSGASIGTTMWAETWANAVTSNGNGTPAKGDAKASVNCSTSKGTTMYGGASITYSETDENVYCRNENTGGGTAPELLLTSGKEWTISGIPTSGAATLTLTFKTNKTSLQTLSVDTDDEAEPSITGSITSGTGTYTITTDGASTINLTFGNNSNTRLDDLELEVASQNVTYADYITGCCSDAELAYSPNTETKTYGASAFTKTLTNTHSVAVTYGSSDETVATVDAAGEVTILKAGTTRITASSIAQEVADVSYCTGSAYYDLTVNKANITPTLSYESGTLVIGDDSSNPTIGGNTGSGTVTYAVTAANPAGCVTVDANTGVVTAVAEGTATITATVATTTNYNSATATADFTVTCGAPSSVDISGAYQFYPGETIELTATPTGGAGTPVTYQWNKGGSPIAGATSATYTKNNATVDDAGAYTCTVQYGSNCATTSANFNLKCMQFYLKTSLGEDIDHYALTKVDATHATLSLNLTGGTTYNFRITDGCNDWYGNSDETGITSANPSNWTMPHDADAKVTTGTKTATYTFNFDFTDGLLGSEMKVSVVYPSTNQAAGKVIYWDNEVNDWDGSKLWYRIGKSNHNANTQLSKVAGTANFYSVTTSTYDGFDYWHIANNEGQGTGNIYWTKDNSGSGLEITHAMGFEGAPVTEAATTVTPTTTHTTGTTSDNDNCEFYTYSITTGMKTYTVASSGTNCAVTMEKYNDDAGTSTTALASGGTVMPTQYIKVTVTPTTGYQFSSVVVTNGTTVTAAAAGTPGVYYITGNATVTATCTVKSCTVNFDKNSGSGGDASTTATYGSAMTTVTAPTRTGYTFDGYWDGAGGTGTQYYLANGTSARNWDKDVTAAQTLYAKWNAKQYTISLDREGAASGAESVTATFDAGTLAGWSAPSKTGYTFSGYWSGDNGVGTMVINASGVLQNSVTIEAVNWTDASGHWVKDGGVTVYAKWTAEQYTITYKDQGGGAYSGSNSGSLPATHTYGAATALVDGVRSGYRFDGWFDNSGCTGDAVTTIGATAKTAAFTLYAKWTQVYTVTWHVGNGTWSVGEHNVTVGNTNVVSGSKIDAMPDAPADNTLSACASKFMGWSCKNFGSTPKTTESGQYDDLFTTVGGSPTISGTTHFYAVFAETAGAAVNTVMWSEDWTGATTATEPSDAAKPSAQGSHSGKTVYGGGSVSYAETSNATYARNDNTAGGTAPELMIKQNETWTISGIPTGGAVTLTLSFITNKSSLGTLTVATNEGGKTPTISGSITGSSTPYSGSYTITTDGASTINITFGNTSNTRLDEIDVRVATVTYGNYRTQCDANLVKVTYDADGGSSTCADGSHDKRNDYTVCATEPTKDYYEFAGWLCSADDEVYAANATIDDAVIDDDFMLTAQWTPVPYDITYNLYGGTNSGSNPATYNVETATITLQDPTKGHDRFEGWFSTYSAGVYSDQVTSIPLGSHGDITLHAKWAERHEIIFDADGTTTTIYRADDEDLSASVAGQGSVPDDPDAPSACSSKVFVGWSESEIDDETDDEPADLMKPAAGTVDADKHYYAVWAIESTSLGPVTVFNDAFARVDNGTAYGDKGKLTTSYVFGTGTAGEARMSNSSSGAGSIDIDLSDKSLESTLTVTFKLKYWTSGETGSVSLTCMDEGATASFGSSPFAYPTTSGWHDFSSTVTGVDDKVKSINFGSTAGKRVYIKDIVITQTGTVYSYTAYSTSCCATKVTLSQNSPEHGTIAFGKTSVGTCGGDKEVSLTITPAAGYQLHSYEVATGSGKVAAKSVSPDIALDNNSNAAQNITLTFAEDANGAYDVTASFSEMVASAWTWFKHVGGATITTDPVEVYVGQKVQVDVAYEPAGLLSNHTNASAYNYSPSPWSNPNLGSPAKAGDHLTVTGTNAGSTSVVLNHNDGLTKTINYTVLALPLVHFVDNIHGETFANVVATVSGDQWTVTTTLPTPTHSAVDDPGASYNTCEREHLHLVGWIESEWADAHPNAEPGDITGAGAGNYYAAGANIDLVAQNGKTFYAVWAKFE